MRRRARKKKAIKQIKLAFTHFLDGAKYPDAVTDKEPYIQFLSGSEVSPAFKAQFEASSAANTSVGGDDVGEGQQGEVHEQEGRRRRLRPGAQR